MHEPPTTPFDDLDPRAVLTPKAIAARLGVDARSIRRAIGRGELVASRACGLHVLAADAAAWWRAGRVTAPAPRSSVREPAPVVEVPPRRRRAPRSRSRLPLPPRAGGA